MSNGGGTEQFENLRDCESFASSKIESPNQPQPQPQPQPPPQLIRSVNPGDNLVRHFPLDLLPLLPIPPGTVLLHGRNGPGGEIPKEEGRHTGGPHGPPRRERKARPPNRVGAVVDGPGVPEQAGRVRLPLIPGIVFELLPLDLGDRLDEDAEGEEEEAGVHARRGAVGGVHGCEGEEEGVDGVVDGVEGGDDYGAACGHYFFAGGEDPEGLLCGGEDGHEEEEGGEGGKVEA